VIKSGSVKGFKQERPEYWSYENVALVFEIVHEVKILTDSFAWLIKIANFDEQINLKS